MIGFYKLSAELQSVTLVEVKLPKGLHWETPVMWTTFSAAPLLPRCHFEEHLSLAELLHDAAAEEVAERAAHMIFGLSQIYCTSAANAFLSEKVLFSSSPV